MSFKPDVERTTPMTNETLKAKLSSGIRAASLPEWKEFCIHWIAFNALYGEEPDNLERSRVMSAISRFLSKQQAKGVLQSSEEAMQRIIQTPPGDMRLHPGDATFRKATRKYKRIYDDSQQDPISRVAAAGAILYQVRCNLIHGSKNPDDQRDKMLVAESLRVLLVLLPALEKGAESK
jgi:hypothetical protein